METSVGDELTQPSGQEHHAADQVLNSLNDSILQENLVTSTTAEAIIKAARIDESLTSSPPLSPRADTNGTSDAISKSTVMITDSQIMTSSQNPEVPSSPQASSDYQENEQKKEEEEEFAPNSEDDDFKNSNPADNSQSMIVVPPNSSTSDAHQEIDTNMSISMPNDASEAVVGATDEDMLVSRQDDQENKPDELSNEKVNADQLDKLIEQQISSTSDEVDKLMKDYEIPNFEKSIEADIAAQAEQINNDLPKENETKKKEERKIENETFQEILGNSSLLKKITQYGDENLPEFSRRPLNGQMVTIAFEAYLKDSHKLVDHNDSLSFILGDGDVISGLDIVVSLMDKNEKCEMIVESRHAYGSLGKQPDIPSDATLFYKIHLKEFTDVTDLNLMSPVERLSLGEAKKLRGNYHYNRQDFHLAIMSYKKGLNYFNEENLKGDELEDDLKKFSELSQALSMNLALSYFKMGECREALDALDSVIRLKNNHVKALYIKGKILSQMGDTQEAVKALNLSLQYEPDNADVKKELAKAQAKHKIQYENEKKMYKKMISGVGKDEASSTSPSKSSGGKSKQKNGNNNTNSSGGVLTYVATGLAIAVASVGIAWFARYRNLI